MRLLRIVFFVTAFFVVTIPMVEAWLPSSTSPQTSLQPQRPLSRRCSTRTCYPAIIIRKPKVLLLLSSSPTALHAIRFNATALSIPVVYDASLTKTTRIDHDNNNNNNVGHFIKNNDTHTTRLQASSFCSSSSTCCTELVESLLADTTNKYEIASSSSRTTAAAAAAAMDDTAIATTTTSNLATTNTATTTTINNNMLFVQARLLLLGAAALYGTNFSLIKLQDASLPPAVATCLRFALAAAATSPWLFGSLLSSSSSSLKTSTIITGSGSTTKTKNNNNSKEQQQQQQQQKQVFLSKAATNDDDDDDDPRLGATLAGLEVGMWNSIGYIAQAIGLPTTLASHSAFLCSMAVVIVPLLDFVSGKQRLLPKQMLGVALAVLGVAFLELGDAVSSSSSSSFFDFSFGEMVSAIQPLAFGLGFWRMEGAMHKYPNQANRSTAAQLLAVFLGSAVYCAMAEPNTDWTQIIPTIVQHDPTILASLLWTGVVTTALSIYMETVALKTLSAAETTLIMSSEPVWGSVFAALLLGEQFGIDAYLGGVFILLGCLISNLGVNGLSKLVLRFTSSSSSSSSSSHP